MTHDWVETSNYLFTVRKLILHEKIGFFKIYFTNLSSSLLPYFIDPADLNFGELLFSLNNEIIKNKIRNK